MSAPEVPLLTVDDLHVWRASKPGMTIFGAARGQLVITTRRLLFHSVGSSGSLELAIERLSARIDRRWDGAVFLVVSVSPADGGTPASYAFMPRVFTRQAELHAAHAAIAKAQSEHLANPYRS
jgi:hypothetical protein